MLNGTAILSKAYKDQMPLFLRLKAEGKTRLIYKIPQSESYKYPWGTFLFVVKDNVSTHNIEHNTPLPWKGYILTAFTVYGFTEILKDLPNHLVAYGKNIYNYLPGNADDYPDDLWKRAIVVESLLMAPIEDVRRKYLCGSLYKGPYTRGEDPYGLNLPAGLPIMHSFGETIYTPTAKSKKDEPLNAQHTKEQFPELYALGTKSFALSSAFFKERGFCRVDGKEEMGWRYNNGVLEPVLADEPAITPDNIRLAYIDDVENAEQNGVEPPWFGKENSRQLAEQKWKEMGITDEDDRMPLTFSQEEADKRGYEDYYKTFEVVMGMTIEEFWKSSY